MSRSRKTLRRDLPPNAREPVSRRTAEFEGRAQGERRIRFEVDPEFITDGDRG